MELRTEIEIQAEPGAVWDALTDFARYPEWNPFIVRAKGRPTAGERLEMVLSLPDSNREHVLTPRVIALDEGRELRWLWHLWFKGLLDGEHFSRLVERAPGSVWLVHGENVSGLFARTARNTISEVLRGFAYMNLALKRRVEKR